MSFSPDFTLSYVSGGESWTLRPSALPGPQQDVVLKALQDGNLDVQDLAILADLQEAFPTAFVKQSYLDNLPPPEEFAMTRFSNGWDGMDVSAMMAFLNEMLTNLAADMRQRSSTDQIKKIDHSMDLADKKKITDEDSAKEAYTAAMVQAAMAIVSAVVGFVGAMVSAGGTSKQLAKAKDLALEKAQALCDKFKAQKNFDSFDKAARKAEEAAKQAHAAAAKAHPLGSKSSGEITAKLAELRAVDTSKMGTAAKKAHQKEVDQLTTALEHKKKAEQNDAYAATARSLADKERANLEQAEMNLSAIEDDIRRLDTKSQEIANMTRLLSVISPMFEQIGHMIGAGFTMDSKTLDALSAHLTAQIQNSDALRDLFQQNAQTSKELFDSVRDLLQKYLEGLNQAFSDGARNFG